MPTFERRHLSISEILGEVAAVYKRLTLVGFAAVPIERVGLAFADDAVGHDGLKEPSMAVTHLRRHVAGVTGGTRVLTGFYCDAAADSQKTSEETKQLPSRFIIKVISFQRTTSQQVFSTDMERH